jgi:hypothetical protein
VRFYNQNKPEQPNSMSMSTPELPSVGIVANLDPEDFKALATYGTFETATPGTVVIEQGKSHGKLFLITKGVLHARRSDWPERPVVDPEDGGAARPR